MQNILLCIFKIYVFLVGLLIVVISILGILFGKEYSPDQISIGYVILLTICLLPGLCYLIYLTCECRHYYCVC